MENLAYTYLTWSEDDFEQDDRLELLTSTDLFRDSQLPAAQLNPLRQACNDECDQAELVYPTVYF